MRFSLIKYETFNHSKTKLRYHLIFSTKFRKKCLDLIKSSIFKYCILAEISKKTFFIETMEIDKDHIHFLLTIKPSESISNVVKILKQFSTYYVWKNNKNCISKFYWKKHYLWTRGYFICTVGECSEERIKKYINEQG